MLIPPSALAVLLGSIAQIPIGDLLVASIIPALILASMFFAYVIIRCQINPEIAPSYDISAMTLSERLLPFVKYVLPLMGIFIVVVGSIIGGVATPTESAALGAVATLLAALAYRKLSWENFVVSTTQTLRFTVMTLFIICGSITFSQILAFSEATTGLTSLVVDSDMRPLAILIGMLLILMFLGCFMDQVSMMMITIPIFMPLVEHLGFNVIWFGVLMLLVLEISLATPPFGLLLFVVKGAAPDNTTMQEIIFSVLPFILLAMVLVALLIVVPEITLILPNLISR